MLILDYGSTIILLILILWITLRSTKLFLLIIHFNFLFIIINLINYDDYEVPKLLIFHNSQMHSINKFLSPLLIPKNKPVSFWSCQYIFTSMAHSFLSFAILCLFLLVPLSESGNFYGLFLHSSFTFFLHPLFTVKQLIFTAFPGGLTGEKVEQVKCTDPGKAEPPAPTPSLVSL